MTNKPRRSSEYSPPRNPEMDQLWYDSMTETMRRWNGKDWTREVKPGEFFKGEK